MDNQFCKNCGQVNFPNSVTCTKCGQPLAQSKGAQFGQPGPPPTMDAAPPMGSNMPTPEKKSKKMYWIVGALLLFLVFSVGAILLVAVGLMFYAGSQSDDVASDDQKVERKDKESKTDEDDKEITAEDVDDKSSNSKNPMDDISFPSGKDVDFGDDSANNSGDINDETLLKFFMDKKSQVGKFKLIEAKTSSDRTIFPGRVAGVQAEYASGSTRIMHRVAVYKSVESAREDIDSYKEAVRVLKAKIRTSKEDQLIYTLKGIVYLAFYNPQGGLHEISSRNGNDILKYYNSYFEQ